MSPRCSTPWADQPRLYALVVFLVYTGRRIGDATALDWREVDLEARTVVIARTKSGSPAAVHLPETALAALANLPKREGKVFGFASRWSVYKPLRAACEAAGIEYLPPHILGRHTFATWMRRYAGADLKALMEAGGWADIKSVARYAHVMPGEAARAADRLPQLGRDDRVADDQSR